MTLSAGKRYFAMRLFRFIFSRIFICLVFIAALFAAIIFLCLYIHSLLPAAWALVVAGIFSLIIAVVIMSRPSPSAFRCAWLALVAALPFFGALVYLLAISKPARKPLPQGRAMVCSDSDAEYLADGADYLKRLKERIDGAKEYVYLEYYIIARGRVWTEIFSALRAALGRGVEVKIIYDGVGSALRAPVRSLRTLEREGAATAVFRKPSPLPFYRLNCRDHRKIAVIDGQYAFTGGVNIADEYANLTSPHGHWKDGGAMLTGKIASAFAELFTENFLRADKKRGAARRNCRRKREDADGRRQKRGKTAGAEGAPPDCPADGCGHNMQGSIPSFFPTPADGCAALIYDNPFGGIYEDVSASLIYSATERVYILTPYLCMDDKLSDALKFAAARGADVRIVIPHIPDKRLTFEITRTYADSLISHGVKIYEYTPGFLHTKSVICDDCAAVGSYNFDFRSMRLNYECAAIARGRFAEKAAEDFLKTSAMSAPRVPVKHGAVRRSARRIIALFAPLV